MNSRHGPLDVAPIALLLLLAVFAARPCQAQLDPTPKPPSPATALSDPSLPPGTLFLFGLEAKFAKATAEQGGKAFGDFFAEDAVTLDDGEAAVKGHDAIARLATWSPADLQLSWTPVGGQMGPNGDMGFTWGHYELHTKDKAGKAVVEKGRYMTIWKKQADGSWKVELDSGNREPATADECCRVQ
jgi:ketosteroid isomerase-like protein